MSWWAGKPTEDVYHPPGNFDKTALINAVQAVERRGFKPGRIVMTNDQHDLFLKKGHWLMWQVCGSVNEKLFRKFMGCKVVVGDVPRGCVGIEDEW